MSYTFILLNIIQFNTILAFHDFFLSLFTGISFLMLFCDVLKTNDPYIYKINELLLKIMNPLIYIFLFSNFLILLSFGIYFPKFYYFANSFIGSIFFIKIFSILSIQICLGMKIVNNSEDSRSSKNRYFLLIISIMNIFSILNKASFELSFTKINESFKNINGFILPKNTTSMIINSDSLIKALNFSMFSIFFTSVIVFSIFILKYQAKERKIINTISLKLSSILILLLIIHLVFGYAFGLNLKNRNIPHFYSISGVESSMKNSKKIEFSFLWNDDKNLNQYDDFYEELIPVNEKNQLTFIFFRAAIVTIALICLILFFLLFNAYKNQGVLKTRKTLMSLVILTIFYKVSLIFCSESSNIKSTIENVVNINESINLMIRQRLVLSSFLIFLGMIISQILFFIVRIKHISLNKK